MTALEAFERIKKTPTYADYMLIKDFHPTCVGMVEKVLKAFEIIKEKKVNIRCLMSNWSLGKYNSYKSHISLTEEEFDLLKEVLL